MCPATRLLDQMLLAIRPVPPSPVREHLCRLGYSSVAIVDVLCHIDATGSPRCPSLDDEDVAGVEELLGGDCGCPECRDGDDLRQGLLRPTVGWKAVNDSDLSHTEGF